MRFLDDEFCIKIAGPVGLSRLKSVAEHTVKSWLKEKTKSENELSETSARLIELAEKGKEELARFV